MTPAGIFNLLDNVVDFDLCLEVHKDCGGILLIFMCKICMYVCVGVVGEAKKKTIKCKMK